MSQMIALLDLGSNAARFVLARIKPAAGFTVLREQRVQTRLGAGPAGRLSGRSVRATVLAAQRFLRTVRAEQNGHGDARVLAVATSAVRDAPNRETLIRMLREREGVHVRVLSGPEEARLGALAALRSLPIESGVIVDVGGGSLQLTTVREGRAGRSTSLPLGALRLTRRFLRADPPRPTELRALRAEVRASLLGALLPSGPRSDMVGLGGTIRALARLHLARRNVRRRRHGLRLRSSDVSAIRARLEVLPLSRRRRVSGLKAERADIIVAGAVVVEELMAFGGYRSLTVAAVGVRDGILLREALDGEARA